MYNPDKCNSFQMQFGFEHTSRFILYRRKKTTNENKTKSEVLAEYVPEPKR